MTRSEFEKKWEGRHPTSWDDPAADEWLQDVADVMPEPLPLGIAAEPVESAPQCEVCSVLYPPAEVPRASARVRHSPSMAPEIAVCLAHAQLFVDSWGYEVLAVFGVLHAGGCEDGSGRFEIVVVDPGESQADGPVGASLVLPAQALAR